MSWRVARSLLTLRDQVNAKFPNRNKASDGTIGDTNHQNRTSDHNPWVGPGVVTAMDITHDPAHGFDINLFTDQLQAGRDPRIKYVIANRLIMDSRPGNSPWKWVRYNGSNPHTSHVHISVMTAPGLYDSTALWNVPLLGGVPSTPPPAPAPSVPPYTLPPGHYYGPITGPAKSHGGFYASERPAVKLIQQALIRKGFVPGITNPNSGWADGKYEALTTGAVKRFQRAAGLAVDGLVGPATWPRLLG